MLPPADAASDSDRTVPVSPPRPLLTAASRHDSFALSPVRSSPGLTESPAAKSASLAALDGSSPQPQAPTLQNGHLAAVPAPTPFDMFGNQTQQASICRETLFGTGLCLHQGRDADRPLEGSPQMLTPTLVYGHAQDGTCRPACLSRASLARTACPCTRHVSYSSKPSADPLTRPAKRRSVVVQLHQAASFPAQDLANGHQADPSTAAAAADASMSRPASDADDAEEGGEEYLPFIVKRSHNLAGPLFNKVCLGSEGPRLASAASARSPHASRLLVVCRSLISHMCCGMFLLHTLPSQMQVCYADLAPIGAVPPCPAFAEFDPAS